MRKLVSLTLVLALIFGVVLVTGCGKNEGTVKVGDEEVKYSEEGGEVTLKDEEGEATYSSKINEEDLGAPIYPGAKMDEDATASVATTGEEGEGSFTVAVFLTEDSVSEVIAWYKGELSGEQNFMDMSSTAGGEEMGMFTFSSGDKSTTVTITADQEDKKTAINIMTGSGAGSIPTP
ncbi:MAG: hypothetical protein JXA49_11055 [Actinobacteria bacterium]|nr:hypothetical protein [Actinomycetota bacterium]